MLDVPCEVAHVFFSECRRPFAKEAAAGVCCKHPENAAAPATAECRPRELAHFQAVCPAEPRRVTPQHCRVDPFREPLHTRTFFAFAARSSREMRELSASSTRAPSRVTR